MRNTSPAMPIDAWRWLRDTVTRLQAQPQYDGWHERLESAMEKGGLLFPEHIEPLKRLPYFLTYSPATLDAVIQQECPEAMTADPHK